MPQNNTKDVSDNIADIGNDKSIVSSTSLINTMLNSDGNNPFNIFQENLKKISDEKLGEFCSSLVCDECEKPSVDPLTFHLNVMEKAINKLFVEEDLKQDLKSYQQFGYVFNEYYNNVLFGRSELLQSMTKSISNVVEENSENKEKISPFICSANLQQETLNLLNNKMSQLINEKIYPESTLPYSQKTSPEEIFKIISEVKKNIPSLCGNNAKLVDATINIIANGLMSKANEISQENGECIKKLQQEIKILKELKNTVNPTPLDKLKIITLTKKIEKRKKILESEERLAYWNNALQQCQCGLEITNYIGSFAVDKKWITQEEFKKVKKFTTGAGLVIDGLSSIVNLGKNLAEGYLNPVAAIAKSAYALYQFFSGADAPPSLEENLLKGISTISKQVAGLYEVLNGLQTVMENRFDRVESILTQTHEQMHQRFDRLEQMNRELYTYLAEFLDELSKQGKALKKNQKKLQKKMDDFEKYFKTTQEDIRECLTDIFEQRYKTLVNVINLKEFFTTSTLTNWKYQKYFGEFHRRITKEVKQPILAGNCSENIEDSLKIALANSQKNIATIITESIANKINLFAKYVKIKNFSTKIENTTLANPDAWAGATLKLLTFMTQYPKYLDIKQNQVVEEIVSVGNELREFIFALKYNHQLFISLLNEYKQALKNVQLQVENIILKRAYPDEKQDLRREMLRTFILNEYYPQGKAKEKHKRLIEQEKKINKIAKSIGENKTAIQETQDELQDLANYDTDEEGAYDKFCDKKNGVINDIVRGLYGTLNVIKTDSNVISVFSSVIPFYGLLGSAILKDEAETLTKADVQSSREKIQQLFQSGERYADTCHNKEMQIRLENESQLHNQLQSEYDKQLKEATQELEYREKENNDAEKSVEESEELSDEQIMLVHVTKYLDDKDLLLISEKILKKAGEETSPLAKALEELNNRYLLLIAFIQLTFKKDYLQNSSLRIYLHQYLWNKKLFMEYLTQYNNHGKNASNFIYNEIILNTSQYVAELENLLLGLIADARISDDRDTGYPILDLAFTRAVNFRTLFFGKLPMPQWVTKLVPQNEQIDEKEQINEKNEKDGKDKKDKRRGKKRKNDLSENNLNYSSNIETSDSNYKKQRTDAYSKINFFNDTNKLRFKFNQCSCNLYTDEDINTLLKIITTIQRDGVEKNCQYLLSKQYAFEDKSQCFVMFTPAINNFEKSMPITYFFDKKTQAPNALADLLDILMAKKGLIGLKRCKNLKQKIENKLQEYTNDVPDGDTVKLLINELQEAKFGVKVLKEKIKNLRIKQANEQRDIFDELEGLLLKNATCNVRILMPLNVGNFHWNTLEITIQKIDHAYDVKIYKHDPKGKLSGEQKLDTKLYGQIATTIEKKIRAIHEKNNDIKNNGTKIQFKCENLPSSFTINRQHKEDGSSCGPITVEDIERRMQGLPLLEKTYANGAEELREYHNNLKKQHGLLINSNNYNKQKVNVDNIENVTNYFNGKNFNIFNTPNIPNTSNTLNVSKSSNPNFFANNQTNQQLNTQEQPLSKTPS